MSKLAGRRAVAVVTCLAVCSFVLAAALSRPAQTRVSAAEAQHSSAANPDLACARCHSAIVSSYARTPMARASGFAKDGMLTGGFVHERSGVRYQVDLHEGEPMLRYERVRPESGPALKGEVRLRYYIGSNTRGRTYLFTRDGLWFETPINWYSKRSVWDMAPGFEQTRTMPLTLPATAGCLRCHATGIAAPTSAENRFAAEPFAQGGIGCAACHGDSAAHVASGGRTATVNPATLSAGRRDSVCLQCHLEGDAVVARGAGSLARFVPGDDLSAAAVYFVNRASEQTRDRATSHYEGLLRSACKRASGDRLTCTTCHDAHSSPEPAERVAYFRSRCLQCHTGPAMATEHHPEQQDCATCHMPTRKTSDISHEQLTDHDVEILPRSARVESKLAFQDPFAPAQPILHTADLVAVGDWAAGAREKGIAYAQFAGRGDAQASARALSLLRMAEFEHTADAAAHASLGYLLQAQVRLSDARAEYLLALAGEPGNSVAASNLASLDAAEGDTAAAKRVLRDVVAADPAKTAAILNLALIECTTGEKDAARADLERALAFDPDNLLVRRFLEQGRYGATACSVR